jgi:uncharacterized protein YjiS (DUF1127 family)
MGTRGEKADPCMMKRKTKMITAIDMLKTAARNYALYRQTRDEIANMPLDIALDLGIHRGDAERIAREAVYGTAA